jgi:type II secretory pathway pseudopilin PulG
MRQRLRGDDGGFSVVEMLAALGVVAVMGTAVAGGLTTAMKASTGSRQRVVAASLATQALEQARSMPATALVAPSTTALPPVSVDDRSYALTRVVTWRNAAGVSTTSCSGAGMFKHVAVTVTGPGGTTPVKSDTLIAPPDTGSQRVRVLDRNRAARAGVTVSIAGGPTSVAPQTTDAKGCALFPGLTAGTYTISVSESGGAYPYVDTQGLTVATRVVVISETESAPLVELLYDRSGALAGTPVSTATNGTYPVGTPLGATVFHSDLLPSGTRKALSAAPTTVSALFPFKTGQHAMWAGTCADADPAFHPPYTRPASVVVTPGAVTNRNLPTKPVVIQVKDGRRSSDNYAYKTMYAVHLPDPGCGPVANPGQSGATAGMVVPFPTLTDGSGVARISLPYGTWRFEPRASEGGVYRSATDDSPPVPNTVTLTPTSSTAPSVRLIDVYVP